MHKLLLTFGILIFGLQWGIAGNECGVLEDIEAVDDFGETSPGEPVFIDVLANDKGDSLRLTNIVVSPACGVIVDWQEDGNIVYVADADTECEFDSFVYEVIDLSGVKAYAMVTITITILPELIVQVERDCSGTYETGEYILNIGVHGGTLPFEVTVNDIDTTLFDYGVLNFKFIDIGKPYEVFVTDSLEQEFYYRGGEQPCVWWLCEDSWYHKPKILCIGNGKVRVEILESLVEEAYWIDIEGTENSFKQIDTIPNLAYLFIPQSDGLVFDTLLNCLAAIPDSFEVLEGNLFFFNVLENDFGQELRVSNIIKTPECGELLEWSSNGDMEYKMNENGCEKDFIIYELENDLGEKTNGNIELKGFEEKDLALDWKTKYNPAENESFFEFTIIYGTPPYSIIGTHNEVLENTHSFSFYQGCCSDVVLEVIDSNEKNVLFEQSFDWNYGYKCYEPSFIHQYLEIECLGEFGGVVHFLERMNISSLDRVFYIDSQNQYYAFTELDTLPNHSYYYLEIEDLGHIDGFINCLTTSIEEETEILSNSFLQLYPNPNQGQFSLQIKTFKPSPKSYPIQVYNMAGQSIWKGTVQSNRLEILDLGNVGSGLYVLQMVMEEEVLVERFWVE
ncbi:MAG: T9SS type A sorting domain-containing protein [Chitinophagales bacterium]